MVFLKKLLLNNDYKISMTKLGAAIVSISGIIITLPLAAQQSNINIEVPNIITTLAYIAVFIGGKLGVDGARDAIDKTNKTKHL